MKCFVLLILFVFSFDAVSQSREMHSFEITCEEGVKDAVSYAEKGEYLLVSYGLVAEINVTDYGFYDFRNNYVYNKYGIKFEDGGCVVTQYSDCYRKKTEDLLFEKYGSDILEKSKKEAIRLFKETDSYKSNLKEKIESDFVFSTFRLDEEPTFIGGERALENFLGKSTNPYESDDWDREYVKATFIVEKNGSISNVRLTSSIESKKLNKELENEILALFEKMPNWKPAIYFEEIVRTKVTINIVI